MNTSDTLNTAADLIETEGWGQGAKTWANEGGAGLCLEGGIAAAAQIPMTDLGNGESVPHTETLRACPAYTAVVEYLQTNWALYVWNDEPYRTATDVIGILRATALIESARESELAEVSR